MGSCSRRRGTREDPAAAWQICFRPLGLQPRAETWWGGLRREQLPGALLVGIFAGMPLGAAFREDRFGRKARHARRRERRLSSPAA